MCGIAGILYPTDRSLDAVFRMTAVQAHRGPDSEGHVFIGMSKSRFVENEKGLSADTNGRLALGHRRLAILDCTDAGVQPMCAEEGAYWIVHNGEVYNYHELRRELEHLNYSFTTRTDTEVILAAYRAWGTACFERFNGMWGLALWDRKEKRLILARDRLGVKPLYYSQVGGGLIFASEIKGILASGLIRARLNHAAAADYLKWGMVDHSAETFFRGVRSFPAGCFAVIDPDQPARWEPRRFWTLRIPEQHGTMGMREAADGFLDLFLSSVKLRMRSDVPVGSCLSGGLDSSAVVCAATKAREDGSVPFNTFTSCSHDPSFDESRWADMVNGTVNAKAHRVYPEEEEFLNDLSALVWHQEEPFTTASIYAQWRIVRAARESGVPVLLDGQGGDELLCGYRKFYLFYLQELARKGQIAGLLNHLRHLLVRGDKGILRWWEGKRYLPPFLRRRVQGLEKTISNTFRPAWETSQLDMSSTTDVRARQADDVLRYSLPALLRYEDRNSMAWAIEGRVPFLDYRLVEFLVGLPVALKLERGRTKAVMRCALKGLVPDDILNRRDKVGFVTPQEKWMRSRLGAAVREKFQSDRFRLTNMFDRRDLLGCFAAFLAGRAAWSSCDLFRVYILDAWMERFDVSY